MRQEMTKVVTYGWGPEAAFIVYEVGDPWRLKRSRVVYEIAGVRKSLAILAAFAYLDHLKRFLRDPMRTRPGRSRDDTSLREKP